MAVSTQIVKLKRVVGTEIANHLLAVPVGATVEIDRAALLCDALELLVPALLRSRHAEWAAESLDGFYFASVIKTAEAGVEIVGTSILISDQRVTPFALRAELADGGRLAALQIRLGEAGDGPLGISGPPCNSRAARQLLEMLDDRVGTVDWAYNETFRMSTDVQG